LHITLPNTRAAFFVIGTEEKIRLHEVQSVQEKVSALIAARLND
jgi:hypothetical protein